MSSKGQTRGNDKKNSKQQVKSVSDNLDVLTQQQSHPDTIIQQARLAPRSLTPDDTLQLQRTIGNQAFNKLLSKIMQPQSPNLGSEAAHESTTQLADKSINAVPQSGYIQRSPDIEATDEAMGKHVVDKIKAINDPNTASSGVHYAHNYQKRAKLYQQDPITYKKYERYADFWNKDYWHGYADPNYFIRPKNSHMTWKLKPGVSAAKGIKAWLKGPTIAECASALVAIEIDTMRAAIGDDKFDNLFASLQGKQPQKELLLITQFFSTSSIRAYEKTTDESILSLFGQDKPGSRSVKKGEWYYFYNHPKYLLKHPGGAFQGENAVCMDDTKGSQKWAGFGVSSKTEAEMMNEMARAYNANRTERDYQRILEICAQDILTQKTAFNTYQSLYEKNKGRIHNAFREDKGSFPTDPIDANDILTAQPYTYPVDNTTRKGGFVSGGGKKLNVTKVKQERDK